MRHRRQVQFKFLLSRDEKDWLVEIAARRGLTPSDVLRQYIREQHGHLESNVR